ncbi:hypothetical protein N7495_002984 [Penicillium taxi]|uniref:uncharacterized protein n=1 Tax=Penicillium taxi TaxID=168475 RepID=UPI002545683B|nr:uncharacterized protein N7495_002984 [Penicillium taxi]KAJ5902456.1 hypothetical protein N7495_002984 [Penicillium taxi]
MTSNQSTSPRTRRALEERSSGHNNEGSISRSLHMNQEKEDIDIYNSTPFPTKPEQILLPNLGHGQRQIISDVGFSYSDTPRSSSTLWPSPALSHECSSSVREQSVGDLWDVSSTADTRNSPPHMWDEDPNSSNSSLQEVSSGKGVNYSSEPEYSDEDIVVLPTATPTIKAVISEPVSPKSETEEESTIGDSSPNVSPIGLPSSPNFVTLDNSSMVSFADLRTNSLSSDNSHSTVVRYSGAIPWIYTASSSVSSGSPSIQSGSQPSGTSPRSVSRYHSADRSHSATSSTPSSRSGSDSLSSTENVIPIAYPRVRNFSSNSGVHSSISSERDFTPGPVSGRWNPHLSTVSSVLYSESSMSQHTLPPAAVANSDANSDASKSSLWIVQDWDDDEYRDSLPGLPISHKSSNSLSSSSKRSNSNSFHGNSTRRPSTASSNVLQILPTWAKIYYCGNAKGINSAMSWIESRPSTARSGTSNSNVFNMMPTPLNINRTRLPERHQSTKSSLIIQIPRTPERVRLIQRRIDSDPRDPRAHWVEDPESDSILVGSPMRRLRHSWSPHLYTDRRRMKQSISTWTTPSFDSTTEPIFGRRNVQVYSFCLGFIFPLAWMIAAFLPLPLQPQKMEMMEGGNDIEIALQSQLFNLHQRRYRNARWWRNLNRWMISLGIVIIVVTVST